MIKFRTPVALLVLFIAFTMNPVQAAVPKFLENCDASRARTDNHLALACNIYWEASNQTIEGQMAVAFVTMNRVLSPHYPDTFSEVVWQWKLGKTTKKKIAQFSWTKDGLPDTVHSKRGWQRALRLAAMFTVPREEIINRCPNVKLQWVIDDHVGNPRRPLVACPQATMVYSSRLHAMSNYGEDITGGALFYHANYVSPWWRPRLLRKGYKVAVIGDHLFYAK